MKRSEADGHRRREYRYRAREDQRIARLSPSLVSYLRAQVESGCRLALLWAFLRHDLNAQDHKSERTFWRGVRTLLSVCERAILREGGGREVED